MSRFEHIVNIYNAGDLEKVDEWLHEEFLFIKDFSMQNKDEYLEDVKGIFANGFKMHDPKLVVENEDIVALNHLVKDAKGQSFRVTAVNFLRDGQSWRIATSRTKIEE